MKVEDESGQLVPSKTELDALKVLWRHGPSTVRFVHDLLAKDKDIRYTSTLKMMQVMTEKGMVRRDESKMTHVYFPLLEEKPTMGTIARRFVSSMYNGSVSQMLVAFIGQGNASEKELQKMKEILSKFEKEDKP